MAKNFGARKNSKYKVVSTSPSVNKTPRGDSTPDVPYDVQQDLSVADAVSPNVFFNGDPVYVKTSHSTKVTGDEKGSKGGVKSGTVGAQSDPIEASPSVFVNGKAVVRVGDVQYMQNKNTVGKVTTSESGSAAHITDEGKIEGDTQPEPIEMPYAKNKPTNTSGTGTLGARTGSPVLLKSGKLLYRVTDMEFIAPIRFDLQRVYIGDARTGMFGNGWQCSYETRLVRTDPHTLSLTFSDDQVFRFSYSDKGFIDTDALGAKLSLISAQTFLLEYYNEPRSELYVNGHLSEIKDLNGNVLNFVREANGKLVRITSASAWVSFDYNRNGHVSRIIDHTNRAWNFTYDKHHNLIEVIDPQAGITYYSYGTQKPHLLERIIDPSDTTILEANYDATGRVMSYREGGMNYTYRYEKNRVIKTDDRGDKTFYGLDDWGVIRAITYPDGSTTREEYNDGASITVDQGGNIYTRIYDERHRLIREVGVDKREIHYTYDRNNPYYSTKTIDDKITAYTYDERYNCLSITYHDQSKESFVYDDRGNLISHTDRSGISLSYAYNDLAQPIRISDAMGGITQYVYDDLGNNTTIIDPMERITNFSYDKLSRLITITDIGKNTICIYYDKAGRKSALIDTIGNTTRYAYDENGFLAREILPYGLSRAYTYERGLLSTITREDGKSVQLGYDKMRRLISQSIGDKTIRTTYDTLGNVLSVDDGMTVVEYVYDVNANIVLERLGDESVSYAYNTDGTRRFIGYADNHYMLKRDESGNISEIRRALESYKLSYTSDKRLGAITYPNQTGEKSTFDPLGRLVEKVLPNTHLTYTYDKSSMITKRNDTLYAYDEMRRLIKAGEDDYLYDLSGNRIDDEQSTIEPISNRLLQRGDETYEYDTLGRLITKVSLSTITEYTYNIEGYLGAYIRYDKQTHQTLLSAFFIYDPLGRRLSKHYKGTPVIPKGHENLKEVPYPDTESISNKDNNQIEYHHRYLYAGDNIVAIYDNDTDELLATLLHEEGIDTPLSISCYDKPTLSTWELENLDEDERYLYRQSLIHTYYYHRDHQNSILSLTNKEGQIVESYSYDAYGNITHHTKTIETYNPYGYTGRETDTDDLYYYRARYYDPTIGRFITPDPIGFAGGDTNFYRYVSNDPVNFRDPSGLSGLLTSFLDQNNPLKDLVEWWDSTPDTSVSKTVAPNSTLPQGKTNTQTNKPKTAQTTAKTATKGGASNSTGAKVKGDVEKKVDECNNKPKLTIRIARKWQDKQNIHNVSSTLSRITIDEEPSFKAYILEEDGESSAEKSNELAHDKDGKIIYKNKKAVLDEKRIPSGTYDLTWHSSGRKFLKKHHHNKLLKLSNNQLNANRGILIHTGTSAKDSEGCLMIGYKLRAIKDGVEINALRRGLDFEAYNDFMKIVDKYACPKAIKGGKIKNIQLIITENFIKMPIEDSAKKLWWGKE